MKNAQEPSRDAERRSFVVTGLVQGVGFRPFVHRLALELGLTGFVRNRAGAVHVEAEGARAALGDFEQALRHRAPSRAEIATLHAEVIPACGSPSFSIAESSDSRDSAPFVAPDVATCEQCQRELFDAGDRRFQYPFSNCTDCGPRLTIIVGAPYDRARTTMRAFEQCSACLAEYEDPTSRRFHAEPNACAECGPRLELQDRAGQPITALAPLLGAAEALHAEQIVAIKGSGGFHLACLASSERATSELRRRKGREEKPFALLVRGPGQALALCELDALELEALQSAAAPIVLARRRAGAPVARAVAGDSPLLGVMLASTPLQHLLCRAVGDAALVMTSGNASHEPIVFEDGEARTRLAGLADRTLTHDRAIHLRCDDSVVRSVRGAPATVRRARGLAPRPTALGQRLRRPLLALGGHDHATFALGRGDQALVSHHLGDLSHAAARAAYRSAIAHYEQLFCVVPESLVHDLHPDYASSEVARELQRERGLPLVAVQHHHAHVVSCMVEHGLHERVLGIACDGTGLGEDGTLWGGEVLLCDRQRAQRLAHLRTVPMPGGERAVHEPWRMALAQLLDADVPLEALPPTISGKSVRVVSRMVERALNCPRTSSMGRLFDAVSALCDVRLESSYDGQAAIELEWAAARATCANPEPYPFELSRATAMAPLQVDTRPLIRELVRELRRGRRVSDVARRFHVTVAAMLAELCVSLGAEHGLTRVALAGGVFANALLVEELEGRLERAGLRPFRAHDYPAGDGGLSLGQLAIAAARDGQAS